MPAPKFITTMIGASLLAATLALGSQTANAQSAHYCDNHARKQASRHANGSGVIGGAVGGAITGAIIGGIVGGGKGAGRGAAIGGGVGAVGGALHESAGWQDAYDRAYSRCMNTSRQPARANYGRPEPWSDEWYDYCASKYRSFNPDTGRYLAYSGKYKMCR